MIKTTIPTKLNSPVNRIRFRVEYTYIRLDKSIEDAGDWRYVGEYGTLEKAKTILGSFCYWSDSVTNQKLVMRIIKVVYSCETVEIKVVEKQ